MKRLQTLINNCVKANNAAIEAEGALDEYCMSKYGAIPSELEADSILDAVYGSCGLSRGMTAEDFENVMYELTDA